MKTLIVEDDYASRMILMRLLLPYGETEVAANGKEAVTAFAAALHSGSPYELVCLDIMLPEMDGRTALREFRALESAAGGGVRPARIIMTTALGDRESVVAVAHLCDAYLVKPVEKRRLIGCLEEFGFAPAPAI
ncbi:MAG TPA: response regulator [Bacteroidota bacterium]|nr:response regulator [Bacteroidota bacterium]